VPEADRCVVFGPVELRDAIGDRDDQSHKQRAEATGAIRCSLSRMDREFPERGPSAIVSADVIHPPRGRPLERRAAGRGVRGRESR
jgi:hypothetical protein